MPLCCPDATEIRRLFKICLLLKNDFFAYLPTNANSKQKKSENYGGYLLFSGDSILLIYKHYLIKYLPGK